MHEPPAAPVILHIPTSTGCNNQCEFCIDDGGARRRFTLEQHITQLEDARSFTDAVIFTTGEPTLNRDLPRLVAAARERGFTLIGLITNGRRLQERALCEALLRAGITEITVSLHAPDAATHDLITRRPGSWDEARRGLAHLAELRQSWPVSLELNCTLVRKNLGAMRKMAALAEEIGVDSLNFNTVEPRGRALEDVAGVVPRYTEVVQAADRSGLDFSRPQLSLSRVPACAGGWAWVQEDYRFTMDGELSGYVPEEGKLRGPMCAGCAVIERCPGVWEAYVREYGWDEFTTVVDPATRRGEVLEVDTGADWRHLIRQGHLRGYRRVLLGGDQPLLRGDLPDLVGLCQRVGFTEIGVLSAARLLGRAGVAEALAEMRVEPVIITIHRVDRGAVEGVLRAVASLQRAGVGCALRYTGVELGQSRARRLAERLGVALG